MSERFWSLELAAGPFETIGDSRSIAARKKLWSLSPKLTAARVEEVVQFYLSGWWMDDLWPAAAKLPEVHMDSFVRPLRGRSEMGAIILCEAADQGVPAFHRTGMLLKAVLKTSNVPGMCKSLVKHAERLELNKLQGLCTNVAKRISTRPEGHTNVLFAYASLLVATQSGREPALTASWKSAAVSWGDSDVVDRVLKSSARIAT